MRTTTPPEDLATAFCLHVAESLPPSVLRELLASLRTPRPADDPSLARAVSTFVPRLVERSRSSTISRPADGYAATLARVLADPSVRDRTRRFLLALDAADPVDAVQDAELVVWLMRERLEDLHHQAPEPHR
jgi:hypothetical protein